MNQIQKMFLRADLQSVGRFIQYEGAGGVPDCGDYESREDRAKERMKAAMKEHVPEQGGYVRAVDAATEFANDCAEIYFSVGMKIGAKLMFQLLNDSMKDNG